MVNLVELALLASVLSVFSNTTKQTLKIDAVIRSAACDLDFDITSKCLNNDC